MTNMFYQILRSLNLLKVYTHSIASTILLRCGPHLSYYIKSIAQFQRLLTEQHNHHHTEYNVVDFHANTQLSIYIYMFTMSVTGEVKMGEIPKDILVCLVANCTSAASAIEN